MLAVPLFEVIVSKLLGAATPYTTAINKIAIETQKTLDMFFIKFSFLGFNETE
jgi:hypothetical protein